LRVDHHCAVIGQCVGDGNFKAFVLSFFWGGILCVTVAVAAAALAASAALQWAGFVAAYALIVGLFAFAFGWQSLAESRRATSLFDRVTGGPGIPLAFADFIGSFGSVWWKRLLPLQRSATFLAWPGVIWEASEIPL
jgi:hypothetical protein